MSDKPFLSSSQSVEWETPQPLFDELNREFSFTLDVCASDENAKCDRYYTEIINGLNANWDNESVWMNPPYGRKLIEWIQKAFYQQYRAKLIVALLPARTSTKWFHEYVYHKTEIRFIKGRLNFSGKGPAPFPSMIVIWRKEK